MTNGGGGTEPGGTSETAEGTGAAEAAAVDEVARAGSTPAVTAAVAAVAAAVDPGSENMAASYDLGFVASFQR